MTTHAKRDSLDAGVTKTDWNDSIPFTHSNYPPFSLNGLPLRWSCESSESHNGFNEPHLRSDAPTLRSDLCASVPIVESAAAASV